jgi:cellulose biosynthesis protein BcsQ
VGKTSISIAIAGFAAIFHRQKTLIIDGDLTGTSLVDIPGWLGNVDKQYFNELILAIPERFADYVRIRSRGQQTKGQDKFYRKHPDNDNLYYLTSSPCFDEILKVIPLISQEDHLRFFQHRLKDIIAKAIDDRFGAIIIDHPPGLYGFSKTSLMMVLDQEIRQRSIIPEKDIKAQSFLITTTDPVDYMAMIPSLSRLLESNDMLQGLCELDGEIELILNKAEENRTDRSDTLFIFAEILKNLVSFPDRRQLSPDLKSYLELRAKKLGPLSCTNAQLIKMDRILNNIFSLKEERPKQHLSGMKGWCQQIGVITNLYTYEPEWTIGG